VSSLLETLTVARPVALHTFEIPPPFTLAAHAAAIILQPVMFPKQCTRSCLKFRTSLTSAFCFPCNDAWLLPATLYVFLVDNPASCYLLFLFA
jgi:hypothetical protein